MKLKLLLKTLPALLAAGFLLTGCGGGDGGSTSSSSGNTGSNTTPTWYLAVRAVTDSGEYSPYSNEASGRVAAGTQVTLVWDAPTRTLGGECLGQAGKDIVGYRIEMGTQSGSYSYAVNVGENCSLNTSTWDNMCGDVYTCEAPLVIPQG